VTIRLGHRDDDREEEALAANCPLCGHPLLFLRSDRGDHYVCAVDGEFVLDTKALFHISDHEKDGRTSVVALTGGPIFAPRE